MKILISVFQTENNLDFVIIYKRAKNMEGYLTIKEVTEKWNLTPRRIQKMCADGSIPGTSKIGRDWAIPMDAE